MLLNRRVEEWTGYERDEILGQPVECLIPERFQGNDSGHRTELLLVAPRVSAPMGESRTLRPVQGRE